MAANGRKNYKNHLTGAFAVVQALVLCLSFRRKPESIFTVLHYYKEVTEGILRLLTRLKFC